MTNSDIKTRNRNSLVSIVVLLFFSGNLTGCVSTPNKYTGFECYYKVEESKKATDLNYGQLIGFPTGAVAGIAAYFKITYGVAPGDGGGTGLLVYALGVIVGGLICGTGVLIGWLVDQGTNPPKHKESPEYFDDPILINGEQW